MNQILAENSVDSSSATKRLNILLFSTLFPHNGEQTLGVFVRNRLLHLMQDENVEATVIAPVPYFPFKHPIFGAYARSARAPEVEVQNGVTVYHPRFLALPKIGPLLNPWLLARSGLAVAKQLIAKGESFDLLDAHYLYPDGVAASKIAQLLNIPFVMTARGSDVTQIALVEPYKSRILNAVQQSSQVITVSQSLKDKLQALGASAEKMTALRNGVDTKKFHIVDDAKRAVSERFGMNADHPLIVFAGWLIPRKRVDIALEALSHLDDNVQLLIVGNGPLTATLRKQTDSLNLRNRVFFVGQQAPEEMPTIFSAADVLILPSEREGWANVLLEAMACGAPVVSRSVDGAIELITTSVAGRLVEGDDPRKYALALSSVLNAQLERESVRAYAQKFGWQETSNGQMKIFLNAIKQHNTGGTGAPDG